MALPNRIRRLIRRETDAECIDRARKRMRSLEKWGKWVAASYAAMGIAMVALAVCFSCLVVSFVRLGANAQIPAAPRQADLAWMGFSLGLMFGFLAGLLLFKGMFYVVEAIVFLRGNRTCELLLRYHDGIRTAMQNEGEESTNVAGSRQPRTEKGDAAAFGRPADVVTDANREE
jgi:hypothetical protein